MKITVIGTGYVGLVSGACFAELGNDVLCLDLDPSKVETLERGAIPIYESGLQDLVTRNVAAGRLRFTTDIQRAAHFGNLQFIAVATPPDEDGSADLQYVMSAARNLGQHMTDYKVVVNKSTVPVGTADLVKTTIAHELAKRSVDVPFSVVSNPEFLKEGAAIDDFMRPARIVVGCDDEQAALHMRALYAPIQRNHERMILMDVRSAELTKYAANAMLATRISFMNEMANLAEVLGADIENVRKGIGSDPRIGYDFLYAGAGYGGSCFPKDVQALIQTASSHVEAPLRVLQAVESANDAQKRVLGSKVCKRFGHDLRGKHFALWGLAFKANTDDMRQASSREVIADLLRSGATVTAYDPVAMQEAARCFPNEPRLTFADSQASALEQADALIIVTEWREFRSPDFELLKAKLKQPVIFDGRNLYDPKLVRDLGFEYFAIGR